MKHLRIGTRGSLLAKWQAESVRKQLFAIAGVEAEIIIIKTVGDKMQQSPLTQIGGKGIFIKELEDALLDESIDLAVHSVKDIPTEVPPGLSFPAVCRRDDIRDCLISPTGSTLENLRPGARVGTSSLRRQAQLLRLRADLDIRELRGNVDTRLRKVGDGEYDAIVLAKAGLDRLGLSQRTFARRLSLEGHTFSEVLEKLRSDLAERYLTDESLSISKIAWLLGYQEVSAFTHAFKRWTGRTPREARAQISSERPPAKRSV